MSLIKDLKLKLEKDIPGSLDPLLLSSSSEESVCGCCCECGLESVLLESHGLR